VALVRDDRRPVIVPHPTRLSSFSQRFACRSFSTTHSPFSVLSSPLSAPLRSTFRVLSSVLVHGSLRQALLTSSCFLLAPPAAGRSRGPCIRYLRVAVRVPERSRPRSCGFLADAGLFERLLNAVDTFAVYTCQFPPLCPLLIHETLESIRLRRSVPRNSNVDKRN